MFSIGDYLKDGKLHNKINLKKLNQKELRLLQESIIDIYKDILFVCEKYNFHVMMVAGSAIGTIRHKGFIPWDDDMDMLISRDDYYNFLKSFSAEFGDKYYITSPFKDTSFHDYCIHIIRKDIKLISLFDYSKLFPNGVAVDICTYENVPNNSILRFFHGLVSDFLLFTTNSKRIFLCRNKYTDLFFTLSWKSQIMYYIRILIGAMLCFISYGTLCKFLDKWISLFKNSKSKYVTIPTGYLHYFGEKVPSDVFDPVRCSTFEGLTAYIPNRVDVYLENRYGSDFMIIPPKEKQESHPVIEFSKI